MGISLRTNVAALEANTSLSQTNERLNSNMMRLSSGQRINRAGDDAAGLAISEGFRANIVSLDQAKRNANDGISLIQTAEGALQEVSAILIRMRELGMQASTETVSTGQRGFIQNEFDQLRSEIQRIGNTANFNDLDLLTGQFAATANAMTFQVDLTGDPTQQINVQIATVSPSALGIELVAMTTTGGAQGALSILDAAIQGVSAQRATLGAAQNRLEAAINNISTQYNNLSAANSRIRDVDVAEETAAMARHRILMQSGVSVLAQANQIPQLALQLLQG
ncbi:MAG: flagellin FliC [Deltaproteobacteria bacterium]|jgi:flagellin|nr:flagellin FliC [Deltaproteobacteria bacterium]MBK8718710.1 flagellin FliC [Deltaproteobacteria bacterium]MBP7290973.1 flagellin FliC [Nannocystaceae bacterium]